jgi:hypothetical protein
MIIECLESARLIPQKRPRGCWILLRVDIAQAYLTLRERGGANHMMLTWPTIGSRNVIDHDLFEDYTVNGGWDIMTRALKVTPETGRHYGIHRRADGTLGVAPGSHMPKPTQRNPVYHRFVHPDLCTETALASYGTAHHRYGDPMYGFFTHFSNSEPRFLSVST